MGRLAVTTLLGTAAVLLVVFNAAATRRLWRSTAYERGQKMAQTWLLWLMPGASLLVWWLLREPGHTRAGDPTIWPDHQHVEPPGHHGHHGGGGEAGD